MKTVGDKLEAFSVTGVKPGFNQHEENGVSRRSRRSPRRAFPGKWKVIYFWPKDFTFVCPTEIVGFDKLRPAVRGARRGRCWAARPTTSSSKLGWRRDHKDLTGSAT